MQPAPPSWSHPQPLWASINSDHRRQSTRIRLRQKQKIKFYLPFDDFKPKPTFSDIEEYLVYKNGVMNFIKSRNKRIENYANQRTIDIKVKH